MSASATVRITVRCRELRASMDAGLSEERRRPGRLGREALSRLLARYVVLGLSLSLGSLLGTDDALTDVIRRK
jgi:hypothetical protein